MASRYLMKVALVFLSLLVLCTGLAHRGAEADSSRNVSGPLVIVTSFPPTLFDKFRTAFERRYPKVNVFVRSKKTSAAISFIEERVNEPVDLFWASAPDAFELLKESGHLLKAFSEKEGDLARIGSYPIDDPQGYYKGFALSGYGILWHKGYLERLGLAAPAAWQDLTRPAYHRHIGISAPSRSGTTHLIVESILQSQGWEKGWATLLEIGGNLATVTARSFGVIDGLRSERFGIGLAIDFFGQSAKAMGAPIDFVYPNGTAFLPANIAMVTRAENTEAARAFVDFVLSVEGQKLLFEPAISRLPVTESVYADAPDFYPNPFDDALANKGFEIDVKLSRRRYHLINSLFDVFITYRLPNLRRTWKAIHEAERVLEGKNLPELAEAVRTARHLASQVPVTASQSADSLFASNFIHHKPGIGVSATQAEAEAQWDRFARDNLDRAWLLTVDVVQQTAKVKP
ncbi:extracellular solute-binding protein [Magnetospira thiophila]